MVFPFYEILGFHRELIVAFLRKYFSEAAQIIPKYNGVLDKSMGDGIMAFFGFKYIETSDNVHSGNKGAINVAP